MYDNYLKIYIFNDIYKKTGLTFDDYLNRPRYEIEAINKIVMETNKEKMKANEDANKELERTVRKGKSSGLPDIDTPGV